MILGYDHLYVTVSNFARSEAFYDRVMQALEFRKGDKEVGGDPHAHYFNPHLQYTIRPARSAAKQDPYAPRSLSLFTAQAKSRPAQRSRNCPWGGASTPLPGFGSKSLRARPIAGEFTTIGIGSGPSSIR